MVGRKPGGDGNGWVVAPGGGRRWGRFGAAGLLLRAPDPADPRTPLVLMQHRATWTASGNTWALTGGARDSHEDTASAALRETEEEAGISPADVVVRHTVVTAEMDGFPASRRFGGAASYGSLPPIEQESDELTRWTYTTVVADAPRPLETTANEESYELRWVREPDVARLDLMPAFAAAWDSLRTRPVRLVIDVANVLGSRPDGWWKDRAGATSRLLSEIGDGLPRTLVLPGGRYGWVASAVAVLEGQGKKTTYDGPLDLHRASASGDDAIVEVADGAAEDGDALTVVVTADRGLRDRLPDGAVAVGPSTLLA